MWLLLLFWAAFLFCAVGTFFSFYGFIIPTAIIPVFIYIYTGAYMIDSKSEIKTPAVKFFLWLLAPLLMPYILIAFDRLEQSPQGAVQSESSGKLPEFVSDSSNDYQIATAETTTETAAKEPKTGGFGFSLSLIFCLWNIYAGTCNAFAFGQESSVMGFESLTVPKDFNWLWFLINEAIGIWCCCGTAKEYACDMSTAVLLYIGCPPVFFFKIWRKSKAVFPALCFMVSIPLTLFYYLAVIYFVFFIFIQLYVSQG